jgi:PAS domain S-box-containing protein
LRVERKVIVLSVIFALLVWVVDAGFDYLFFYEDSFWNLLIFNVSGLEVYMRSVFSLFFVVFGLLVSRMLAERKQQEEKLRATQSRLQHLISVNPAVIYSCRASGDYGATYVSDNITAQLGYEPRELLENSRFWADHIHPDDAPRVFTGLQRVFEHGQHIHEYRFRHKDGGYRWMHDELKLVQDMDGSPLELVGFWIDITERRNTEELLRESEASNRALLQAIPDMIFRLSSHGAYLDYKPGQGIRPYVPPSKFLGSTLDEVLPPEVARPIMKTLRQALESGKTQVIEYALSEEDGEHAYEGRLAPCGKEEVLGVVRDVTQRKQAERILHDFVANVSHEFKTPLTAIQGSVETLLEELPGKQDAQDFLEIIQNHTLRLRRLTDELLMLSQMDAREMKLEFDSLSVSELIQSSVEVVEHTSVAQCRTVYPARRSCYRRRGSR